MRKRFFQLCSGPLKGRTFGSDSMRTVAGAGGDGATLRFAVRADGREPSIVPFDPAAAGGEQVYVYETFARADEITLEVVLCKYVGTTVGVVRDSRIA